MAEWLRRPTRNRLGLSRVGSSPASVDVTFCYLLLEKVHILILYSLRNNYLLWVLSTSLAWRFNVDIIVRILNLLHGRSVVPYLQHKIVLLLLLLLDDRPISESEWYKGK